MAGGVKFFVVFFLGFVVGAGLVVSFHTRPECPPRSDLCLENSTRVCWELHEESSWDERGCVHDILQRRQEAQGETLAVSGKTNTFI